MCILYYSSTWIFFFNKYLQVVGFFPPFMFFISFVGAGRHPAHHTSICFFFIVEAFSVVFLPPPFPPLPPHRRARAQRQGLKVGAFGKERLVYHHDYVVHEELGFCRYLAAEFTEGSDPNEIMLEFSVRPVFFLCPDPLRTAPIFVFVFGMYFSELVWHVFLRTYV